VITNVYHQALQQSPGGRPGRAAVPDYKVKYSLDELYNNTPRFDAPIVDYGKDPYEPPKGLGSTFYNFALQPHSKEYWRNYRSP